MKLQTITETHHARGRSQSVGPPKTTVRSDTVWIRLAGCGGVSGSVASRVTREIIARFSRSLLESLCRISLETELECFNPERKDYHR
jgi:hypothetical protein